MDRIILHCDCNGFFASVECVLDKSLQNVPMAVCGNPESRHGIILAKNELAKKYNIVTAETVWQAKKKCPQLVLVQPHHDEYHRYSKLINQIYQQYTDLVEPFSIDESWLDVTGSTELFGDGVTIANTIRERIKHELGITISVGVSFNKIFAKLGSDYKKPDATTVISKQNYKAIVYPLPVDSLLSVGKSMTTELNKIGIHTIGQLAQCNVKMLEYKFGKNGRVIYDYATGKENNPVKSIYEKTEVKSVGNSMTFRRNLIGLEDINIGCTLLSDSVAARLRSANLKCNTIQITIKTPEFKSINRQKPLDNPTNISTVIRETAMNIIKSSWSMSAPIRMLAITGCNLIQADKATEQISIFEDTSKQNKKEEKLEIAIDTIRNKFGLSSVKIANTLKNDIDVDEDINKEKDDNNV